MNKRFLGFSRPEPPSSGNGSMDIHGLTEVTSLENNDEFPFADSSDSYNNKKTLWSTIWGDLKTIFDALYTAKNALIIDGTHTKITYDSKGLVTAGADATYTDISAADAATNVTGAELEELSDGSETTLHSHAPDRELLTADRIYYVRTDGSDSNDGLTNSSGGAFATIQKAIDVASQTLDTGIYDVYAKLGNTGTFTENVVGYNLVGGGKFIIEGDTSTPTNTKWKASTGVVFTARNLYTTYVIKALEMSDASAATDGVFAANGSYVQVENVYFAGGFSRDMFMIEGAMIEITANYNVTGSSAVHINAQDAIFRMQGFTLTLTGTPAFSTAFAVCSRSATLIIRGDTFTGSATGKRYDVTLNGVIDTNGAGSTYLPGNSAGTNDGYGVYN